MTAAPDAVLFSGPLGMLAHPHPDQRVLAWIEKQVHADALIIIPEIADYEIRRSLASRKDSIDQSSD